MRDDEMEMGLEMLQIHYAPQRNKYPSIAYFFPGKENDNNALEELLDDLDIGKAEEVVIEEPMKVVVTSANVLVDNPRDGDVD